MTALQETQSFVKALLAQQEINRHQHGNEEADEQRIPIEWGVIAAEHLGHLMGALRQDDNAKIEKEILHVGAVLLECWNSTQTRVKKTFDYKCQSCEEKFTLEKLTTTCPLCQGRLERVD